MLLQRMILTSLAIASSLLYAAETPEKYDVDITLENVHDKDFTDLPVLLPVAQVFGRGVDYAKFNRDGFHVYDQKNVEVPFMFRAMPPAFSLATSEIVIFIPQFAKAARAQYRITNTSKKSATEIKSDSDKLVSNPNNLIPNGGFEKGNEGWEGGKIVSDVVKSGKNSLLLEAPGAGGQAAVRCTKALSFVKDKFYYFGIWAKTENVTRHACRWEEAGGRITLGPINPLTLRVQKDHFRLMDDRDWYCYEANEVDDPTRPPCINVTALCLAGGNATLAVTLNQINKPYVDAAKPARIWLDEALLFEQPKLTRSFERVQKAVAPDGFFLYRRAATCLAAGWVLIEAPKPFESIDSIKDAAAQGERKLLTLGINTPKPIDGLFLEIADLKGPGGNSLGEAIRDVEFNYVPIEKYKWQGNSLEGWVIDGNPPRKIDRPGYIDYLIGYRIPASCAPGTYTGTIKVKGDGKDLAAVPVELSIVDYPLKAITERFVGEIYNNGCGPADLDDKNWTMKSGGGVLPERDTNYYKYYSRFNFTSMSMFSHFLPFSGNGTDVDMPKLLDQMKEMRDVAGCTAGVVLYWDASIDKQGRKGGPDGGSGLWSRCGRNVDAYRAAVKKLDDALAAEKLPRLVYQVWDEARFCDDRLALLKDSGALSMAEMFGDEGMEAMKRKYFTFSDIDDPSHEFGPAMVRLGKKLNVKMGITGWPTRNFHRYQVGMMIASSDLYFWHHWYGNQFIAYHPGHKAFVRCQNEVGLGEGMIDLRYFDTLKDVIADAKKKNTAKAEVAAAEKYLQDIFDYCTGDMYWFCGSQVGVYNGSAEDWGDDWFYDRWRTAMRTHTLAILHASQGKVPAKDDAKKGAQTAPLNPSAAVPAGFAVLILKDGEKIVGKISAVDQNEMTYQAVSGERKVIAMSRIEKIER